MYPRTSPARLALGEKVAKKASLETRGLPPPKPIWKSSGAPADEPPALEPRQALPVRARPRGPAALQGNDLGDRLVAIDDEHDLAVPHLVQVPREIVLQLGDVGPLHVAIIA